MPITVRILSALASCTAATVRPDEAALYIQMDNFEKEGALYSLASPCTTNISLPFDSPSAYELRVMNPWKGIHDVVVCSVNNENAPFKAATFEDGRSRRYLVFGGKMYAIVATSLLDAYLPITFGSYGIHPNLPIYKVTQMRFLEFFDRIVNLQIAFVGGTNWVNDDTASIQDYKSDISQLMTVIEDRYQELAEWRQTDRHCNHFVLLFFKAHSAPIESYDPVAFERYYGKKYSLMRRDARVGTEFIHTDDIVGYKTCCDLEKVHVRPSHYDDHPPLDFEIDLSHDETRSVTAFDRAASYRLSNPIGKYHSVRKHKSKDKLKAHEYPLERSKHPLRYPAP